jgi:hypothetical protein
MTSTGKVAVVTGGNKGDTNFFLQKYPLPSTGEIKNVPEKNYRTILSINPTIFCILLIIGTYILADIPVYFWSLKLR